MEPGDFVLGVDVGGTKILIGCIENNGTVFKQKKYPMNRATQESSLHSIFAAIDDFMKEKPAAKAPLAMGIGLVGHVNNDGGEWLNAINIPINEVVPLSDILSKKYGIPVFLDNDVHAATLAEMRLGVGQKYKDFVYVNIGTGISAGIVCNGRLVRGCDNYAGEFGHMIVEFNGELCKCGRKGCLETISSGGGMVTAAKTMLDKFEHSVLNRLEKEGKLAATTIFEMANAGDELSLIISERALNAVCISMVNLINLLNPEMIVLGGGVLKGGWLLERIMNHINVYTLPVSRKALKGIAPTILSVDSAGMIGASCIAWNSLEQQGLY